MTHNLTHTAKEADGISGVDRTKNIIFTEQKGPETAEHQRFPGLHLKVVGCRTHLPKSSAVPSSLRPDISLVRALWETLLTTAIYYTIKS